MFQVFWLRANRLDWTSVPLPSIWLSKSPGDELHKAIDIIVEGTNHQCFFEISDFNSSLIRITGQSSGVK